MDLLLQLIFGAFLGAVSGYYTNTVALKKLFSNNGIIARKKDSFIDEISKMVSKKIINYNSIYAEIKKDKFKNNIIEFFKKLKDKLILKTSIKIKNVIGFNETKTNIINWSKTNTNESISFILEKLSQNIKLSEIIDDNQANNIINNLADSFIVYISDNKTINEIIYKAYNENDDKYKTILKEILDNIIFAYKNNDNKNKIERETISLIKYIIKYSDIKKCFCSFLLSLSNSKIKDLFSVYETEEIKIIINKLSENNEFQNILDEIIEELYIKLKNTDKTVYELLNHNIANRLQMLLADILPKFIDIIIPIINENKSRLDSIIESAVDEEIENIDGVFVQFVVKIIRNVFLNDISSKYKIVQKVIEYIEKYKDNVDEVIEAVTNDIMNYLNKTKISDILKNVNNIDNIKDIAKDIIIFNIKEIPDSWIEKFFNLKINVLVDSNMIDNLYSFLEKEIIDYIVSNLYESVDKARTLLFRKIDSINIKEIKIDNIINIINQNKSIIKKYLYGIYCDYKNNTLYDFINDFDSIIESLFNLLEELIDKYSNLHINELIIKKESNIDDFLYNNSYNSVVSFIEKEKNFISNIIDSLVIKTIKNNMGKLNKDEIAAMANDFMGKELEPINILGALLGALFGLATAYFLPANSFNSSLGILNYIIEPLVYILIGLITNVLAIYSIFQPYEPLFGIKKKVFWGAVACEKNRFAVSMSNFVNDRLMEKEGIFEIIGNKEDIENNLIRDNYKTFFNYMLEDDKIDKLNIFSSINNIVLGNINSIKYNFVNSLIKNNYLDIIKNNKNNRKSIISYINDNIDNIFIILLESILKNINFIPLKTFIQNIARNNFKDLNRFKDVIVPNVIKAVNSQSVRDRIFSIIIDLLDNEISKKSSKQIKEMFDGEIVNLIRSNNEFIFSMMNRKLNESLNNNRYEIRDMVIENVPLKNDFVIDLTDKIILNLINNKLPIFINDIRNDFMDIIFNFLDDNILSKNISYIFGNERLYEYSSLRKYLDDVIDNNQNLIYKVADKVFILAVNDIDYKIMEKYIDSFLYNTDDDLHKFIRDLFINIYNYSRNISIEIKNYLGNILYPRNIKEIINVEKYFDDIFEDVFKYSKEHLDNFLLYAAKDDNLIDKDNLMKSLINVLNKLESDALINKLTFIELKKVLSKLRNDLPDIIDDKTKYYFLNLIIDSAKDDINLIIDSIDFSAITKEEIDNMNPKNIHDVFNSFAKEYLNRLKLYGMFGGIVGIILVIIKHISLFNTDISNILNIIVIILTVILSICMIVNILKNISD